MQYECDIIRWCLLPGSVDHIHLLIHSSMIVAVAMYYFRFYHFIVDFTLYVSCTNLRKRKANKLARRWLCLAVGLFAQTIFDLACCFHLTLVLHLRDTTKCIFFSGQ